MTDQRTDLAFSRLWQITTVTYTRPGEDRRMQKNGGREPSSSRPRARSAGICRTVSLQGIEGCHSANEHSSARRIKRSD
jgi:hypothetical protein